MELYPIKKLLKEHEDAHPEKKAKRRNQLLFKSSHSVSLSPKEQVLKQFYHQIGMQRFDRQFTVSWAQKQEINGNPANPSNNFVNQMTKSAFFNNNSTLSSPCFRSNTLQNPNLAVHLSDKQDQERLGTQIYQPEVYELRRQNEDNIAQTLDIKNQHKRTFNNMAQQYNLKSYRSELSTSVGPRLAHSVTCSQSVRCLTPQTPKLKTEPSGTSDTSSTDETPVTNRLMMTKSHFFTFETPKENPAAIIGELEEIYLKDLKSETSKMGKVQNMQNIASSPYKYGHLKQNRRQLRKTVTEGEYKNMLDDKILLGKFEDPYGNNLPFERPIHANIKNKKDLKLQELETKAQILKNLKSIHTDMAHNILLKSPSKGKLPRIKHSFDESCDNFMQKPILMRK